MPPHGRASPWRAVGWGDAPVGSPARLEAPVAVLAALLRRGRRHGQRPENEPEQPELDWEVPKLLFHLKALLV